MQWNKKSCPYLKTVLHQVQTTEQTQQLRLPDEMPDVGRILCGWGQCTVRSKQWQGETLVAGLGLQAWVLYLPEDGSAPRAMEAWMPFQLKWSVPASQREKTAHLQGLVEGVEARILSGRKMMVRCDVSVLCRVMESSEEQICTPGERPEDVQLLTNVYPAVLPVEAGEKTLQFEQELELAPGQRWISWQILPQITQQNMVGNRVILHLNAQLHYVYLDGDDRLGSGQTELPFAQYIDLEREYDKQAAVDVLLTPESLEVEQTAQNVRVQCRIQGQYVVWEQSLLEITEDGYSPMRAVELIRQTLALPMELDRRRQTVEPSCTVPEGETVDTVFFPRHPTQFREGEQANVVLSGTFQILYRTADGDLQTHLQPWEQELCLAAAPDSRIFSHVMAVRLQPQAMQAEMEIGLQTVAEQTVEMVTGLTVGEMQSLPPHRPSLILRPACGQSLWQMAKENGSTVADIRRANGLSDEPQHGQMILIPVR